jgi:hypothetical protein
MRKFFWVLVAIVVLLGGYFALTFVRVLPPLLGTAEKTLPPTPTKTPQELHAEWKVSVGKVLAEYDQSKNASGARDALELIRVGAVDKDVHLELYLGFRALAAEEKGAEEQVAAARNAFLKS